MTMTGNDRFFLTEHSSKARIREAENARRNRQEIVAALSRGQVSRRELMKWGLWIRLSMSSEACWVVIS